MVGNHYFATVTQFVTKERCSDQRKMPLLHSPEWRHARSEVRQPERLFKRFLEPGRMKRPLARPDEVPGVRFFELGVASLGEAELMSRSLSPAGIEFDEGHEIQVVRVKSQDAQQPSETREIAIDDLL